MYSPRLHLQHNGELGDGCIPEPPNHGREPSENTNELHFQAFAAR